MQLRWRPYRWALQPPLITACGPWSERRGWLLREHHHQPERISGSKFLALRFQALSGLGLAIGLGIAPLLGR